MWLTIHEQGLTAGPADRERVERRLGFALGRFGDRVGRVTVHLIDVNGPRGGADKRCRVVAHDAVEIGEAACGGTRRTRPRTLRRSSSTASGRWPSRP